MIKIKKMVEAVLRLVDVNPLYIRYDSSQFDRYF